MKIHAKSFSCDKIDFPTNTWTMTLTTETNALRFYTYIQQTSWEALSLWCEEKNIPKDSYGKHRVFFKSITLIWYIREKSENVSLSSYFSIYLIDSTHVHLLPFATLTHFVFHLFDSWAFMAVIHHILNRLQQLLCHWLNSNNDYFFFPKGLIFLRIFFSFS